MLDNEFEDPDLDRYLERFDQYDPSVAIMGDAYTPAEAKGLNETASELYDSYPYKDLVVVPKCEAAFDILDDDIVLGYPMGYSDIQADDISTQSDWRDRRVHLLGASPPNQYDVIQDLTQPTLTGEPPADITGLDWNGLQKVAYHGEYWSRSGWQPADHLSIRETVHEGLKEVKQFWLERRVWPDTEPIDLYGPAVTEPDELIYMDKGGDPIPNRDALEAAHVDTYDDYRTLAFRSETQKTFIEYREMLK